MLAGILTAAADDAAELRARFEALREEVSFHDDLYFRQAMPVISDLEYDRLKAELRRMEASHPEFQSGQDGASDDRSDGFARAAHLAPMLSLDKCYSDEEVLAFDVKLRRALERDRLRYVVEPKYDGVAISVVFEAGHVSRVVTRGDGREGDDVTANVLTMGELANGLERFSPRGTANEIPELIELRGEIYVSVADFEQINRERREAGESEFSTPRNYVAGTLKTHSVEEVAERRLAIVFHGWGAVEPAEQAPKSFGDYHGLLTDWGLPSVQVAELIDGCEGLPVAIETVRTACGAIPIDGVVIKLDNRELQQRLGNGAEAPRWALARKFAPPQATTALQRVVWQVGRTGVLTPVAEFDPVELAGATISRATLHHAGEFLRRDFHAGDWVVVAKAGQIIPSIVGVDRTHRADDAAGLALPTECPSCGYRLSGLEPLVALRCENWDCPDQVVARVQHFASRAAVNIRGLGPRLIAKLVAQAGLRSPVDLYGLTKERLLAIDGVGARGAEVLLGSIEASRGVELAPVVLGLGLDGVGIKRARSLAKAAPDLAALLVVGDGAEPPDWWTAGGDDSNAELWREVATEPVQALIRGLVAQGINPTGT